MTFSPGSKTVWPKAWVEAIKEGRLDILIKFKQFAGGTWEINGITADGLPVLFVALYHGKKDIVEWLLKQDFELCPWSAAALGNLEWIKNWFDQIQPEHRADELGKLSSDGWTMLHLAAFFGENEMVNWLIEAGAPLDALSRNGNANQPLHASIAARNQGVAEQLIQAGASLTYEAEGWTPLRLAQENGMSDLAAKIEQLIDSR